jgi:hypothetical protein
MKRSLIVILLLSFCLAAYAQAPAAKKTECLLTLTSGVTKTGQPLDELAKISIASKIHVHLACVLDKGPHYYQVELYDGQGQKAYTYGERFLAEQEKLARWVWYTFKQGLDKPGQWTVVVSLDGQTAGTKKLDVVSY